MEHSTTLLLPAPHRCSGCKQMLPPSFFGLDRSARTGLSYVCRHCHRARGASYRARLRREGRSLAHRVKPEYARRYYRTYKAEHPEKVEARLAVAAALRNGVLRRLPCEVCGRKAIAHHEDYSKPLAVRWLCHHHHGKLHHDQLSLLPIGYGGRTPRIGAVLPPEEPEPIPEAVLRGRLALKRAYARDTSPPMGWLYELLDKLPRREAMVLAMQYGLCGQTATLQQLARVLGLAKERVRQIRIEAASALRQKIIATGHLVYATMT